MPTLTVAFAGIICFEGPLDDQGTADQPKLDAAFVLDAGHVPQFTIGGAPHISLAGAPPITDLTLGLGSSGATTSPAFFNSVPHLGSLTRSGVKLDRASANTFRFTLAPVMMDVLGYFPNQAVYGLDRQIVAGPQCVAMITSFAVTLGSPSLSIFGNEVDLTRDAWVLFENLMSEPGTRHAHIHAQPPAGGGPPSRSHFKIHRQVTTAADDYDIADVYELPAAPCGSSNPASDILNHIACAHPTVSLHPECSNSQWP